MLNQWLTRISRDFDQIAGLKNADEENREEFEDEKIGSVARIGHSGGLCGEEKTNKNCKEEWIRENELD